MHFITAPSLTEDTKIIQIQPGIAQLPRDFSIDPGSSPIAYRKFNPVFIDGNEAAFALLLESV